MRRAERASRRTARTQATWRRRVLAAGASPASDPLLPHSPRRSELRQGRHRHGAIPGLGLAPRLAALRDKQWLERESYPRQSASNRCSTRLSYPMGGPELNRRPTLSRCSTRLSYRPREEPSCDPRHTPRQGRAHRTEWQSVPLRTVDRFFALPSPDGNPSRRRFSRRPAEASRHAAHPGQSWPVTDHPWSAHRRSSSLLFRLAPDASERKRHR